jgi:hypothetical protein
MMPVEFVGGPADGLEAEVTRGIRVWRLECFDDGSQLGGHLASGTSGNPIALYVIDDGAPFFTPREWGYRFNFVGYDPRVCAKGGPSE